MGNNGIWALEKHPMEFLYGYSVAAELRPETRYDQVVEALGGHGELVRAPDELRPALERALAASGPALVNVLTDPSGRTPASRTWRRAKRRELVWQPGAGLSSLARSRTGDSAPARTPSRRHSQGRQAVSGPNENPPAAGAGGFKLAPSGRAGVRALRGRLATQAAGGAD